MDVVCITHNDTLLLPGQPCTIIGEITSGDWREVSLPWLSLVDPEVIVVGLEEHAMLPGGNNDTGFYGGERYPPHRNLVKVTLTTTKRVRVEKNRGLFRWVNTTLNLAEELQLDPFVVIKRCVQSRSGYKFVLNPVGIPDFVDCTLVGIDIPDSRRGEKDYHVELTATRATTLPVGTKLGDYVEQPPEIFPEDQQGFLNAPLRPPRKLASIHVVGDTGIRPHPISVPRVETPSYMEEPSASPTSVSSAASSSVSSVSAVDDTQEPPPTSTSWALDRWLGFLCGTPPAPPAALNVVEYRWTGREIITFTLQFPTSPAPTYGTKYFELRAYIPEGAIQLHPKYASVKIATGVTVMSKDETTRFEVGRLFLGTSNDGRAPVQKRQYISDNLHTFPITIVASPNPLKSITIRHGDVIGYVTPFGRKDSVAAANTGSSMSEAIETRVVNWGARMVDVEMITGSVRKGTLTKWVDSLARVDNQSDPDRMILQAPMCEDVNQWLCPVTSLHMRENTRHWNVTVMIKDKPGSKRYYAGTKIIMVSYPPIPITSGESPPLLVLECHMPQPAPKPIATYRPASDSRQRSFQGQPIKRAPTWLAPQPMPKKIKMEPTIVSFRNVAFEMFPDYDMLPIEMPGIDTWESCFRVRAQVMHAPMFKLQRFVTIHPGRTVEFPLGFHLRTPNNATLQMVPMGPLMHCTMQLETRSRQDAPMNMQIHRSLSVTILNPNKVPVTIVHGHLLGILKIRVPEEQESVAGITLEPAIIT